MIFMSYEIIKKNYDRGLWNATMVALAVKKGVINPDDYKTITGDEYQEK